MSKNLWGKYLPETIQSDPQKHWMHAYERCKILLVLRPCLQGATALADQIYYIFF